MSNTLGIGDIPVVTTLFTNAAGDPANPSVLTATWLSPLGRAGSVTPSTTSMVGTIETTLPEVDEPGRWWYYIDGNGAADDGHFDVDYAPAAVL